MKLTRTEFDVAGTPIIQKYSTFTDNSGAHVQRNFDYDVRVGQNTYPYVNGIIWEPSSGGNCMTIATNRPGGVTLDTSNQDQLSFFLTRTVENINIEKGFPEKLVDDSESRSEFLISISNIPGIA